jgi:uncharacterized protein (TIGR03905 family)
MMLLRKEMDMKLTYKPAGVCSQLIKVEIQNDIIKKIEVLGGCSGNLQGVSRLLVGMNAEEAISRIEGIRCGEKATSCPDQISKALRKCLAAGEK